MIKYLRACLKEAKYFKEVTDFKSCNVKYLGEGSGGRGKKAPLPVFPL